MNKLTFTVITTNGISITELLKEVDKIHCRIQINFESGTVTAMNIDNDASIDAVIELIRKYFKVKAIDINNTTSQIISPDVKESTLKVSSEPKNLNLKSENDTIIDKIGSNNATITQLITNSLKNIHWALFTMNASHKEIQNFIQTQIAEIHMRYNRKPCIAFSVGDIVRCYYGMHLENNGRNYDYANAIVCKVLEDGMTYVVPIVNGEEPRIVYSYITIIPFDIIYNTSNNNKSNKIAWLDRGGYMCPERFQEVIGKATPEFLKKILCKLPTSFDFSDKKQKKKKK